MFLNIKNFKLPKEQTKLLHFAAVGGAIGKLVNIVEVLKVVNPGLYQLNKLATVSYQSVEDGKEVNLVYDQPRTGTEKKFFLRKISGETEFYI